MPKKQFIFSTDELPEISNGSYDPIEEQTKAMYTAIGELSKIDKAIVMLYLEDYSYAEISKVIGITTNNIAVKMNRIKSKLKRSMSPLPLILL